ncbi:MULTISPECIES: prolipoprotein diacylglyceryl transferase [Micrococcaceae]|jgi:prolipoprotein diacylglyceryl transferase|uniref:prolipoprotein diacylglyceryl transferase n=1 Tax=Micrococcaceae TaxID=1268 RepID=UPI001F00DF4E|nr:MULTISPECIES: prolipoprotein diacylglyceryl transferase [Micrococcaceae]UKA73371.1 prolipoprotein diacylglyceryl transferase [Arthrobacter sp. FW306-06-A]WJH26734.1 prolipoprotein diacylglyceryl transferase [Pseudarthrobacter defluvii]
MNTRAMTELFFPSPTVSAFQLGPLTIRFYALAILAGIVFGVWLTARRLRARGGTTAQTLDVVAWAVPFGIIGGRLYHVITDNQLYFAPGRDPWGALRIWEGGLGIWGAVALGLVGAAIGARRAGVPFTAFVDAAAPGLLIAQALGRWGNWFNNELYGQATDLPWKLQIHAMNQAAGQALTGPDGSPDIIGYFQPTFLYESLWCLAAASLLMFLDRKYSLGAGSVFALYIMLYTAGRFVFELLRSDPANTILGLRVNTWVAALVFLAGLVLFQVRRRQPRSAVEHDQGSAAQPTSDIQGKGTPL